MTVLQVQSSDPSLTPCDIDIQVSQKDGKLAVSGYGASNSSVLLDVEVPIVYDVTVVTSDTAGIQCRDLLESAWCHLTSQAGHVTIAGVKTANLLVHTEAGDVTCSGAIQGSVRLSTTSGNVRSDRRFTGPSLDINTESGSISVTSSYSDQSKFTTMTGQLSLNNIHNTSYVAVYEAADVRMVGVDGTVSVYMKAGSLDMQISCVRAESRVHVEEGDIHLKLSESQPLKVCATGREVVADEKFSNYGGIEATEENYQQYNGAVQPDQFSALCQVRSDQGRVNISAQDWAASLGLKLRK